MITTYFFIFFPCFSFLHVLNTLLFNFVSTVYYMVFRLILKLSIIGFQWTIGIVHGSLLLPANDDYFQYIYIFIFHAMT